ncbi:MAG: LptF/LptG family permease [Verrucomicrobia bacterium]|nr:LptF/LptG family permease [Verrucomicrobiota bacterium]
MTLLDRYIFKSVFFTCAAAVGVFTFIMVVPNAARDLMAYVLSGQLTLGAFVRLVLLIIPFVVTYALPMGMLTGVLLTLGRLSADSEITAMRAAGLGLGRIARPAILLAALGVALGLYFNFYSMPRARVEYHRELGTIIRANPLRIIVPKTYIRDFPGYVVYVNEKTGGLMKDFWLWQLDDERRAVRLVHAASGRFEYDENDNALILTLTHAQVETRNVKQPEQFAEPQLLGSFEQSEPIRLSLDRFFRAGSVHVKQEWLTYDQLQAERARLAALPLPTDPAERKEEIKARMKLDLIYHEKFNTALAILSLALIGVPLGIKVSRRETSANFAVALGLTLAYYLMTVAVKVLDRHPEYRPDLLLWVPNLILIAVGVWLFSRIGKK